MTKKLFKFRVIVIIMCVLAIFTARHILNEKNAYYFPHYSYEEVSISDSEERIFKYTGLSPAAVRDIIKSGKTSIIKKLNTAYFEKPDIEKEYIFFPTTIQESLKRSSTPMAPLCDGDILVTFNTHTLDWRHGHLALVTDSENGIILEHMSIGNTSAFSYANKWGSYPSFAILRYPDKEISKKAAEYAKENLVDVPYSLFAGLINKDKSKSETIDSSHCSHIVWQAYKAAGVDLDSDGGRIVTPEDVAKSKKLRLVQIFGLNSADFNTGLMK